MADEVKTEYRHIRFERKDLLNGKVVWDCRNKRNGDLLGGVDFYEVWSSYVFWTTGPTAVFDSACLLDIANFLDSLEEQKP